MSWDEEAKKGLGITYDILLDAVYNCRIKEENADKFFAKIDPIVKHRYDQERKGKYGRCEFKDGLSEWYNYDPDIFQESSQVIQKVLEVLEHPDLGKLYHPSF